jgi:hypothetical protein
MHSEELAEYFEDFDELRLQASSHQNAHKLSYYADAKTEFERLAPRLRERLKKHEN